MERRLRDFLILSFAGFIFVLVVLSFALPLFCVHYYSEGDLHTTACLFLVWFLSLSLLATIVMSTTLFRDTTLRDVFRDLFGISKTFYEE